MLTFDKRVVVQFLRERIPNHGDFAYQHFADRLDVALRMAQDKMRGNGINPDTITREQVSIVLDWCFRLAFDPQVDKAIAESLSQRSRSLP